MAGAKLKDGDILAISNAAVAAMPDETAFEALTMLPIANVVTAPSFGFTSSVQRHNYLDSDFSSPDKSVSDGAESDIVYGVDPDGDAGQAMCQTAASDKQGRYVVSITRLDGSVTFAWGPIVGSSINGGSVGDYNERTHQFVQALAEVDYTP